MVACQPASTARGVHTAAPNAPKSNKGEFAGVPPKLPAASSPTQYAPLEPSPDTPVTVTLKLPLLPTAVLCPLDLTLEEVGGTPECTTQYTVPASSVVPVTVAVDVDAWAPVRLESAGAAMSSHSHTSTRGVPTGVVYTFGTGNHCSMASALPRSLGPTMWMGAS